MGQWRARMSFESGDFAMVEGLEFMYVFNLGGTMTESSNYDAAPPVPPAYGIWRQVAPGRFEVKYEFYPTATPHAVEELTAGGGWLPAGRGVFLENITIADDGESYASTVGYEALDRRGSAAPRQWSGHRGRDQTALLTQSAGACGGAPGEGRAPQCARPGLPRTRFRGKVGNRGLSRRADGPRAAAQARVSRKGSDEGNAADTVLGTWLVRPAAAVVSRDFFYVGKYLPSSDAAAKAKGALVYGSDIKIPNMLYARLLLSEIPHGIVAAIDSSEAESLPGVVRVFSCFNTPDTPYSRYRLMPGQESCPEDETLFSRHVRFVGDRVAAVVATSQAVANAAVRLIRVTYEELPALLTPDESLQRAMCDCIRRAICCTSTDSITASRKPPIPRRSPRRPVRTTQRIHQAAMEPHVCLAEYDGSENLTIWSPSQGVFGARTVVADLLGLSYNRVRVIKVPTGGSFGAKQEFILEPLTAYMAMQIGKPVRLALDQKAVHEGHDDPAADERRPSARRSPPRGGCAR